MFTYKTASMQPNLMLLLEAPRGASHRIENLYFGVKKIDKTLALYQELSKIASIKPVHTPELVPQIPPRQLKKPQVKRLNAV